MSSLRAWQEDEPLQTAPARAGGFSFGTKAETLERLAPCLSQGLVPPGLAFSLAQWRAQGPALLEQARQAWAGQSLIVRSSALHEDGAGQSLAGAFESVAGVDPGAPGQLERAVEQVLASYAKLPGPDQEGHQVLIQPMVADISMAGVVFTQDLNTGAPYYVINYDDVTGRHDTITGGYADINRTLLIRRERLGALKSPRFRRLMAAVREVEQVAGSPALDIEFAVTRDERVYILQVRRMAVQENWNRGVTRRVDAALSQIGDFLRQRFRPALGALGPRSIFGVMPDWNPVEMLGAVPHRLASSLYAWLITDSVWAEARAAMGYRDQGGRPLMFGLAGRYYIDVRESFNSFLPAGLPEALGEKLVAHWLETLERNPELHDKVEFEVATTVHSLDFAEGKRPALAAAGLSPAEIDIFSQALQGLTNQAVAGSPDLLARQMALVASLEPGRRAILASPAQCPLDLLHQVRLLLEQCRELGTRPFSVLARCAFMAEELLRSLVRLGALERGRAEQFRGSVRTVLSDFLEAVADFQAGRLAQADFLAQYGHLRPGTYDILSKRYDQHDYFTGAQAPSGPPSQAAPVPGARPAGEGFSLSDAERRRVDGLLAQRGYAFDSAQLFGFMARAIAQREEAKFQFTKNISEALELICQWGRHNGLSRRELSHLPIQRILEALSDNPVLELEDHLRSLSLANQQSLEISRAIRLPFLITQASDVDVVPLLKCRPNFITQKQVRAPVLFLSGHEDQSQSLAGKVLAIEGADPGFDWIFLSPIAGLVTKYGGANSHMAIRCAELGVPAAIGCGEQLFDLCLKAREISLDCGAELIRA